MTSEVRDKEVEETKRKSDLTAHKTREIRKELSRGVEKSPSNRSRGSDLKTLVLQGSAALLELRKVSPLRVADERQETPSGEVVHSWIEDMYKTVRGGFDSNPYTPEEKANRKMWKEQCCVNFPLLYLASIYLYDHAQKRGCTTFLFATRDCCHWFKVFKKLFPGADAHYFHSSRNMFEKATAHGNQHFRSYVRSLVKKTSKTIYVDVHGSCKRAFAYFRREFGKVPQGFLLSARFKDYNDFPSFSKKYLDRLVNLVFEAHGSPIEMLNFDVVGTLQDFNEKGPVRDEPEYKLKVVDAYHKSIARLVDLIEPLEFSPLGKKDSEGLLIAIRDIFANLQATKPTISKYATNVRRHPGGE